VSTEDCESRRCAAPVVNPSGRSSRKKGEEDAPPVLLEDRRQVPPLQLAQQPAHGARPVPPLAARDEARRVARVEDELERLEDRLLRERVVRRRIVVGAEVVQGDVLLLEEALAVHEEGGGGGRASAQRRRELGGRERAGTYKGSLGSSGASQTHDLRPSRSRNGKLSSEGWPERTRPSSTRPYWGGGTKTRFEGRTRQTATRDGASGAGREQHGPRWPCWVVEAAEVESAARGGEDEEERGCASAGAAGADSTGRRSSSAMVGGLEQQRKAQGQGERASFVDDFISWRLSLSLYSSTAR